MAFYCAHHTHVHLDHGRTAAGFRKVNSSIPNMPVVGQGNVISQLLLLARERVDWHHPRIQSRVGVSTRMLHILQCLSAPNLRPRSCCGKPLDPHLGRVLHDLIGQLDQNYRLNLKQSEVFTLRLSLQSLPCSQSHALQGLELGRVDRNHSGCSILDLPSLSPDKQQNGHVIRAWSSI